MAGFTVNYCLDKPEPEITLSLQQQAHPDEIASTEVFFQRLKELIMLPRIGALFLAFAAVTATIFTGVGVADPAEQRLAGATVRKAAYTRPETIAPPAGTRALDAPLVLSAPPRETAEEAKAIYQPVAEYLSTAIGRRVIYRHPGTWGAYRSEMLRGGYDLVFDGPHFNSYRVEKLNHNILVRVPAVHEFAVVARADSSFKNLNDLAGHSICSHAPPNLGTLVFLSHFENPARQPVILDTRGWESIFTGVQGNRCRAGVIPMASLKKLDPNGRMRVIFKSKPMLNQAISASPRLSPVEQQKVTAALLSPAAAGPTARLRSEHKVGPAFAAATNKQYEGLSSYLRNEWGYY